MSSAWTITKTWFLTIANRTRIGTGPNDRIYEFLDPTKSQIRLLRIDSLEVPKNLGQDSSPILHCSLVVVSLDDTPEYDAISYVWGDPNPQETIFVNSQSVQIGENLFEALRCQYYWQNGTRKYLWADALCIDQQNIAERSHQVSMMRDIYSRAQVVRICLGMAIPQVGAFFEYAASDAPVASLFTNSDGRLDGYKHVISKPWWRRLWVVQEAALASQAVVHCGEFTVPFATLFTLILELSQQIALQRLSRNQIEALEDWCILYSALVFDYSPWLNGTGVPHSLDEIVQLFRELGEFEVTNPKDRLYGALGLLPKELDMRADYDLSLAQTDESLMVRLIEWTKSLSPLAYSGIDSKDELWPSWLSISRRAINSVGGLGMYNSSLWSKFHGPVISDDRMLVPAFIFDEVSVDGVKRPRFSLDTWDNGHGIESMRAILQRWRSMIPEQSFLHLTEESASVRFWSALRGLASPVTVTLPEQKAPQEIRDLAAELDLWLDGTVVIPSALAKSRLEEACALFENHIWTTKSGRIARSVPQAKVRDVVAIIYSCSLPLILRPEADGKAKTYRIISSCFCEGVMFGECIREQVRPAAAQSSLHLDEPTKDFVRAVVQLHEHPNCVLDSPDLPDLKSTVKLLASTISTDQATDQMMARGLRMYEFILDAMFNNQNKMLPAQKIKTWIRESIYVYEERPEPEFLRIFLSYPVLMFQEIIAQLEMQQDEALSESEHFARKNIETLAIWAGLVMFEILLSIERLRSALDDSVSKEDVVLMERVANNLYESFATVEPAKKYFDAIYRAVLDEVQMEKASESLYEEITLV